MCLNARINHVKITKKTRNIRSESFLNFFTISLKDFLKLMQKFSRQIQCIDAYNELDCGKNLLMIFMDVYGFVRKTLQRESSFGDGEWCILNIYESLFRHKPKYHFNRATTKEFWNLGFCIAGYGQLEGLRNFLKLGMLKHTCLSLKTSSEKDP